MAGRRGRPGPRPKGAVAADSDDRQDAKTLYDTATATELAREEWKENRAFRAYCQTATLASVASVAFALPQAIKAARHLTDRK